MMARPRFTLHPMTMAILLTTASIANAATDSNDDSTLEEIKIIEKRVAPIIEPTSVNLLAPDSAELLKNLPGANINKNGMISGIAQYRGMYGDRTHVAVDGINITSGGPNAMDPPLHYAPSSLLQSITVHRGIAPVSAGQETIGGAIEAETKHGSFSDQSDYGVHGRLILGQQDVNDGGVGSVFTYVSNDTNLFYFSALQEQGNDAEFAAETVTPTEYDRQRFELGYGFQFNNQTIMVSASNHDTDDAGTPSLPMDIAFIESDFYKLDYQFDDGNTALKVKLFQSDIEHGMTNYHLRQAPAADRFRETIAIGEATGFLVKGSLHNDDTVWTFGTDGNFASHDADISNPNNAAFAVTNFNDIERDILGIFVERIQLINDDLLLETGLRFNRVEMDAGEVTANMAMAMNMSTSTDMANGMDSGMDMMESTGDGMSTDGAMDMSGSTTMESTMAPDAMASDSMTTSTMAMGSTTMMPSAMLQQNFNNTDRSKTDNNVDWTAVLTQQLTEETQLTVGFARKSRSASYQERYLWMPMQATAGLADGNNYVGNIDLNPEVAHEIDFGFDWRSSGSYVSPRFFYRDVKDYIQGTPTSDATVVSVSTMMGGDDTPLQFSNVDAKLYGMDMEWGYTLTDHWQLTGIINYVRGERKDIDDDLYRVAPLNTTIGVNYHTDNLQVILDSSLYQKQDKVSLTNSEEETSGYGVINLTTHYKARNGLGISAGINNLTDKNYRDHLAGYNRAVNDVALGERLSGLGRNVFARINWEW